MNIIKKVYRNTNTCTNTCTHKCTHFTILLTHFIGVAPGPSRIPHAMLYAHTSHELKFHTLSNVLSYIPTKYNVQFHRTTGLRDLDLTVTLHLPGRINVLNQNFSFANIVGLNMGLAYGKQKFNKFVKLIHKFFKWKGRIFKNRKRYVYISSGIF